MTPIAQAPRNTIFNGDYIDVMQAFDTGSIDFILTDHALRDPLPRPAGSQREERRQRALA